MEDKKQKGGLVLLLVVGLLVGSFFIGRLSAQVEYLSKGGSKTSAANGQPSTAPADPAEGLAVDRLKVYAREMKMNGGQFDKCMDEGKYAQKIKDDAAYGQKVGVSGTPTTFIDDVLVVGAVPQSVFEDIIDFQLAGGNWSKPSEKVAYLVDKDESNIEVEFKQVEHDKGYVTGSGSAKVKLVEFSDFQCPFCARAYPTMKAIMEKYGDKVSLEYRHYPLSFHPYAQKAAEASECAGEQGKFWEMHDKMFDLQS